MSQAENAVGETDTTANVSTDESPLASLIFEAPSVTAGRRLLTNVPRVFEEPEAD
jgi:hypothetical protein